MTSDPATTLFIPRGAVHSSDNRSEGTAARLSALTPGVLGPEYFHEIMKRHGLVPAWNQGIGAPARTSSPCAPGCEFRRRADATVTASGVMASYIGPGLPRMIQESDHGRGPH